MKYSNVNITINDEVISKEDIFNIIKPLWWGIDIYEDEEKYKNDLMKFNKEQRNVFAIQRYLKEVRNGGHNQFYFNSTGILWEDAMNGCIEVGINELYEIIRESAKRISGNPSKNRVLRNQQIKEESPSFKDLDTRVYEMKDIEERLMKYIYKNKEKFFFVGIVSMPE